MDLPHKRVENNSTSLQFLKEKIGFNVKVSFASRPVSRLIR